MPNPVDSTMPLQQRSAAGNLPSAKVTASWPTNLLPSSTATDSTNQCATRASNCTKIYSTAIQAVEANPESVRGLSQPLGKMARRFAPPNYLATLPGGLMFVYIL